MKKFTILFLTFIISCTGCSSNEKDTSISINNPYEIAVEDEILSYYDTNIPSAFSSEKYDIIQNDNKIRSISLTDSNAITYNNISVGDNISKIKDSFSYEYNSGNIYMVLFNGTNEEDPMNADKEDSWIWINYITDEEKITSIQIYDVKYGKEAR
jgi:hypothetical protein